MSEQNEYISILDLLKSFPSLIEHIRLFEYEENNYPNGRKTVDPLNYCCSDFCYSTMKVLPAWIKNVEDLETAMMVEDTFFVLDIPYCSGSDYSGSLVEVSNFKAILEDYEDIAGCYTFYGGHGTFSIAMDVRMILMDGIGPIEEILMGLEAYPLIDEDLHTTLEMEETQEQWVSDGRQDFIRALEDSFQDFLSDNEDILAWYHGYLWCLSDIDEDKIDEFYRKHSEKHNAYPHNESASDIYFPFDFTEKIDEDSFKRFIAYPSDMSMKAYKNRNSVKALEDILHCVTVSPCVINREWKESLLHGILRLVNGDYDHKQDLIDALLQ